MNLGLDIDGVLTNIEAFQFKYGIPFFKKEFNKGVVNECGKDIKQIFGCTEQEEHKFWGKYLFQYAMTDPIREHAAEYTNWAYKNGHRIYIITSRVFTTQKSALGALMRIIVKTWLKMNHVKYDKIVFCDADKTKAIKEYGIQYMVEDDPDNIIALKDLTHVICMNAKCNEHIEDSAVIRCCDFKGVINYVANEV